MSLLNLLVVMGAVAGIVVVGLYTLSLLGVLLR